MEVEKGEHLLKYQTTENVQSIPINELQPFRNHPFTVADNEDMAKIVESIGKVGTITPLLARPLPDGGYELISGHRRLEACRKLGLENIPVIVREMTDDEAVIAMVDANLQREHILPSEKAFAYKMKLEAIKHQGVTSRQVVGKRESADSISANESGRTVQRYIRLTKLIPELLKLMDEGKIAFSVGVELSYLSPEIQRNLYAIIERDDHTPSYSQAYRLHKAFNTCSLTKERLELVMSEEKANQRETLKIPMDKVRKFAPKATDNQLEGFILKACDYYQRYLKRQRDRER